MDPTPPLPPEARYSRRARLFHWWMFAFVALAYLLVNLALSALLNWYNRRVALTER